MSAGARFASDHQSMLAAAQAGDEIAFEQLTASHRRELHIHCYRMLGSLHEADDALQETLLRAWRALPRFGGRHLLRPWLYRIATNVCITLSARDGWRTAVDPYPDQPDDARAAPEARYEEREAIELAFVAALQHLPGRQRAVLLLRDVLGFSAAEVAASLDTTVASVNSALQRARRTVDERRPDRTQQATLRGLGDARVRELAQAFVDAWERGDVKSMLATLTDDLVFTMPPDAPVRSQDAVAALLPVAAWQWRLIPTWASGQLAFGAYRWDAPTASYRAAILDVVGLRVDRIAQVVAFARPDLFARCGLPEALPGIASA
jgi:RNA polymerase sigma-70 factor (ECF subfamily)